MVVYYKVVHYNVLKHLHLMFVRLSELEYVEL